MLQVDKWKGHFKLVRLTFMEAETWIEKMRDWRSCINFLYIIPYIMALDSF